MQEVNVTGNKNGVVNTTRAMAGWLPDLSMTGAARMVGIGLILMFVFAIFAEFVAFSELIVKGDEAATLANVEANTGLLYVGMAAYVVVLVLDLLVSWALYVVFRPVNRDLALLMAGLRLAYTVGMFVALAAMALVHPYLFVYVQVLVYAFFITHILVLGYLAYMSNYVHRFFGAFLVVASFSYVFLTYGEHALSQGLYEAFMPVFMIPATFAELSLGLWLMARARRLPGMIEGTAGASPA
jgi:hypothetical protein